MDGYKIEHVNYAKNLTGHEIKARCSCTNCGMSRHNELVSPRPSDSLFAENELKELHTAYLAAYMDSPSTINKKLIIAEIVALAVIASGFVLFNYFK